MGIRPPPECCEDNGLPCDYNCEGRLSRWGKDRDLYKKYFVLEDHHLGADTLYCELMTWAVAQKIDFRLRRDSRGSQESSLYFKSDADAMAFKLRWL
jgi:hypothetical protein